MSYEDAPLNHSRELLKLAREKFERERLKRIVVQTSNEPTIVGLTEYFIWIGRKRLNKS